MADIKQYAEDYASKMCGSCQECILTTSSRPLKDDVLYLIAYHMSTCDKARKVAKACEDVHSIMMKKACKQFEKYLKGQKVGQSERKRLVANFHKDMEEL